MKVLFVCTANVCRSPLAEGYLRFFQRDISASSAGVAVPAGRAPFDCAIEVAKQYGFDISECRSRQITFSLAMEADHILCMETWHVQKVIELDQNLLRKVRLLGSYLPGGNRLSQIPDPRDFTMPETLPVFKLIKASIEAFLGDLERVRLTNIDL